MDERLNEINRELKELNEALAGQMGWSGGWTICGRSMRSGRPGWRRPPGF